MRAAPAVALVAARRRCLPACKVGPNFKPPAGAGARAIRGRQHSAAAPHRSPRRAAGAVVLVARVSRPRARPGSSMRPRREISDLKVAYLRIVEARIQVQSARAQGLPSLECLGLLHARAAGSCRHIEIQGHRHRFRPDLLSRGAGAHCLAREAGESLSAGIRCLVGDRSLRQGAPLGGGRGRAERRGGRVAQRPAGVSRGRGRAELFSAAGEPSAAADHARCNRRAARDRRAHPKPARARSRRASPTWIPRAVSSRVWRRSCPPTSRRSRPPGTRSRCSSDRPPRRWMPSSGIRATLPALPQSVPVGHALDPGAAAARHPQLRGGSACRHRRDRRVRRVAVSRHVARRQLRACAISAPGICSTGRAISIPSARASRCPFFMAARWSRACDCRARKRRRRR